MRYRDTGQVHRDFHRTTNATIRYLRRAHGLEFLDDVLHRTGRDVYRSLHDALRRGDSEPLAEHWRYYFEREEGEFDIERLPDGIRMTVRSCPAVAYLERRGIPVDPAFCRQTTVINEALVEGTPFEAVTEVLGGGRCVQWIRRRRP